MGVFQRDPAGRRHSRCQLMSRYRCRAFATGQERPTLERVAPRRQAQQWSTVGATSKQMPLALNSSRDARPPRGGIPRSNAVAGPRVGARLLDQAYPGRGEAVDRRLVVPGDDDVRQVVAELAREHLVPQPDLAHRGRAGGGVVSSRSSSRICAQHRRGPPGSTMPCGSRPLRLMRMQPSRSVGSTKARVLAQSMSVL